MILVTGATGYTGRFLIRRLVERGRRVRCLVRPDSERTELDGLDVDVDGILGWLFDWLIDFVVGLFADMIEDMLQDQIDSLLGDTMSQLVSAFNITETLQVAPILPGMAPT